MKRSVASLFVSLCVGVAHGAPGTIGNPCGIVNGTPTPYVDTVVYNCAPTPTPTSTGPTLRWNTAGVGAYWYCKVGAQWHYKHAAATWDFLTGKPLQSMLSQALTATDPVAALNAVNTIAMGYAHTPLSDPSLTPVWCPYQAEMIAGTPKPDPVAGPGVWRTPNIGTFTLYTTANGALSGLVSGRKATAGALCDCTAPVAAGTSTYCPLAGAAPAEVTLCKVQP